ncbi:hypothetical protein DFQ14_102277 [Halopolyspora algeriensis]|uniref:Uncharacterized protein n=1 Tax=Halopolyspora algeriensis TaxID=1500506 RepID=A0A368VVR6_9ACTN|nr:hypothetical protein [Halopolyspora algeriensis]RCW45975.1 hypothetical protein DFQ14_102277 [Halopolyspora algeriensis]TQM55388.1 hypothetical protein FHU43_0151 [Halopolyspora algeriensis]
MGTEKTRPESTVLSDRQKHRVTEQLRHEQTTCAGCGSGDFTVGQALYVGFLFLDEENGNYMVALTCNNPECPAPRTGITLHESAFLDVG